VTFRQQHLNDNWGIALHVNSDLIDPSRKNMTSEGRGQLGQPILENCISLVKSEVGQKLIRHNYCCIVETSISSSSGDSLLYHDIAAFTAHLYLQRLSHAYCRVLLNSVSIMDKVRKTIGSIRNNGANLLGVMQAC